MQTAAKKYLAWFTVLMLLSGLSLAGWNGWVDPYGLYREDPIQGFNHFRLISSQPAERLIKAHELNKDTSPGLLLGTSRVDWGLSPESSAAYSGFPHFYNAGLGGCTIYEAYRYLQHAQALHPRKVVVLGLDIEMFNTTLMRDPELNRRLAVHESGRRNLFYRWSDLLPTLYSLSAIEAGFDTIEKSKIHANLSREEMERRGGTFQEGRIPPEKRRQAFNNRRSEAWGNFRLLSHQEVLIDMRLQYFEQLIDLAHRNAIQLEMFITPYHFTMIGLMASSNNHDAFLGWKRKMLHINAEVAARHNRVPYKIWDFSLFHPVTRDLNPTDDAPRRIMKYYMECSHYRKITGDLILARIFGSPDADPTFGVPLSVSLEEN